MNMLLIIYIVLNVLIQFDAFRIENVESDTGTEFYEMTKIVLELQAKYCDYIPLCTVNVSAYNIPTYEHRKRDCCQPCSCEPDCKQSYTCCPDYWIRDVIPDVIFADSDILLDTLKNKSVEDALKVSSVMETMYVRDTARMEECLSSGLITNSRFRKGVVNTDAYIMVTKCPTKYGKRNKKEFLTRKLCESPVDIDNADSTSIDQLIPTTSSTSRITYRNMYCLECNEGTRKGNYWSSWFGCINIETTQALMHKPEETFLNVKSTSYCNIKFQPPTSMNKLSLRKCNYVHVSTCSEDWILNANDTDMVTLYENTCKHFFNPVLGELKRMLVIFNNIACQQCNPEDYDKECIASDTNEDYDWIELNTEAVLNLKSSTDQIPLDVPTNNGTSCGKGFIFDNVDNICRRVYCPGNFFNVNDHCVPSVLEAVCNYSLKLVVSPSGDLSLTDRNETVEFERTLSDLVNDILQGEVMAYAFKIWRQLVNRQQHNHLIYVQFRSDRPKYIDSLKIVQKLLQTLSTSTVQLSNRRIPLTTSFLKYDVFSVNKISRNVFSVTDALNGRKRRSLELVHEMRTDNFTSKFNFKISRTHLCSRLLLKQNEINVVEKGVAKIVRTNKIIQGTDFDITADGLFVYVCIKDFLNIDSQVGPWRRNSTNTAEGIQRTTENDDSFIIYLFITIGISILLIVTGLLLKHIIERACRVV